LALVAARLQRCGPGAAGTTGPGRGAGGCHAPAVRLPALRRGRCTGGHYLGPAPAVRATCALLLCRAGAVALFSGADADRAARPPLGLRLGPDQPDRSRWTGRAPGLAAGRTADAAAALG